MIKKRPASERGGGNHGWLDTRHTFSFSRDRHFVRRPEGHAGLSLFWEFACLNPFPNRSLRARPE
jgi:hypothetical protein